jgi:pilus assembly protein CpaF
VIIAALADPSANSCRFAQMSLLNCLCAAIPARERVVTCEEVFELRKPPRRCLDAPARRSPRGNGSIPLHRLVKEALQMRPSRLVVCELRQEERLDQAESGCDE